MGAHLNERVKPSTQLIVRLQDVMQKVRIYDDGAIVNCLSKNPDS